MNNSVAERKDGWVGFLVITIFLVAFGFSTFSAIHYNNVRFDDGYNATVAANLVRHGEYRVSYPDAFTFYNPITTGVTVLLPTACVYSWFGISSDTTQVVAFVYGLLSIYLLWYLFGSCLKPHCRWPSLLAAVLTIVLLLPDKCFFLICANLWGEVASFCFLLIALIGWNKHSTGEGEKHLLISGAMVAAAFLTKSAMIFFVVSWFGIVAAEVFWTKSKTLKDGRNWVLGFALGFALVDSFKLVMLGEIMNYLRWWRDEWHNMLRQSGGYEEPSLSERFDYLQEIFSCNQYFVLLIVLAMIGTYLYFLLSRKREHSLHTMAIGGITAASLIVYFVLLGSGGLMSAKRLVVNELILKMSFLFLLAWLFVRAWKYRMTRWVMMALALVLFLPYNKVKVNLERYFVPTADYTESYRTMEDFLKRVDELPEYATLYADGWSQEPNITLYLERTMIDISDVARGKHELDEKGYLVVGQLDCYHSKEELEEMLGAALVKKSGAMGGSDASEVARDADEMETFSIYQFKTLVK